MDGSLKPTAYADINAVLLDFQTWIQSILKKQFYGMYVYGSLALGDFNPKTSDIDFIVVTDGEISDDAFNALQEMHTRFEQSGSPWAHKIEAAYLTLESLNHPAPTEERYPQLEKGRPLVREPLEIGWSFQRHILREHGIPLSGEAPAAIIDPVKFDDMRWTVVAITGGWLDQARHDAEWLEWVSHRMGQAFVVLTLCRSLYVLDMGTVASKPAAAHWVQQHLSKRWSPLIERSLAKQHDENPTPESDVIDTLYFIQYTFERSQAWEALDI